MPEPRAALVLAAEDATGAAFASANKNLAALERNANRASAGGANSFKSFTSSVLSARGALASLGIVLSGRALFSWMSNAVQATQAVGEQREEVGRAKQAFTEWHAATDALGESLAVRLTPAIAGVAKAMDEFTRWRDGPTTLDTFNAKLARAKQDLETLPLEISRMEVFRGTGGEAAQALAALEQRLATAKENAQILGAGAPLSGDLEEIDVQAIGRQRIVVNQIEQMLARHREANRTAAIEAERELVGAVAEERERFAGVEREAAEESAREAEEKAERRRELLSREVDDLKLNLMTEVEYESEIYARRQEMLDNALQDKLISEGRYAQLSTDLARRTADNIEQIEKEKQREQQQSRAQLLNSVGGLFSALSALSAAGANESKKKFEEDKKVQRALAIVSTLAGTAQALTSAPFPINLINAATVLAFGMAQVKQISATSWSGGGGGSYGGGAAGGGGGGGFSEPAMPTLSASDRGRSSLIVNVTVQGSVLGEGGRMALAEDITRLLRDHTERTDDTLIDVRSRNGQQLSRRSP